MKRIEYRALKGRRDVGSRFHSCSAAVAVPGMWTFCRYSKVVLVKTVLISSSSSSSAAVSDLGVAGVVTDLTLETLSQPEMWWMLVVN